MSKPQYIMTCESCGRNWTAYRNQPVACPKCKSSKIRECKGTVLDPANPAGFGPKRVGEIATPAVSETIETTARSRSAWWLNTRYFTQPSYMNSNPPPVSGNAHVSEIGGWSEIQAEPITLSGIERAYNEAVLGMNQSLLREVQLNGDNLTGRLTQEWHAPKPKPVSERVEFGTERKIKLS